MKAAVSQISNVIELTPREERRRFEAEMNPAPKSFAALLRSELNGRTHLVDLNVQSESAHVAWNTDAVNHILALVNFPHKLRGFLDCLIGIAGENGSDEIALRNWDIGLRARSGFLNCSDTAMERWVTRQKRKLREWMFKNNFLLVEIRDGKFDLENWRNEITRYRLHVNELAATVVLRAKAKFYWRAGKRYNKLQGRALREAARELLYELPESPALEPPKQKKLSEQQKFDRRHKEILTLLAKQRDALAKSKLSLGVYLELLEPEMLDTLAEEPGLEGVVLNPEKEPSPDALISTWEKVRERSVEAEQGSSRGTDKSVGTPSETNEQTEEVPTSLSPPPEIELPRGVPTKVSAPPEPCADCLNNCEINQLVSDLLGTAKKRFPVRLSAEKRDNGAIVFDEQNVTPQALVAKDFLDDLRRREYCRTEAIIQIVTEYVRIHLRWIQSGIPINRDFSDFDPFKGVP
jgi:hypothetical protein